MPRRGCAATPVLMFRTGFTSGSIGGDVVDQTLVEHQTWIAGEVLAVAVNDGEPQPDAAQAEPTLNGLPVQIRLSRAPRSD